MSYIMLRRKGGDESDYPGADYDCPESSPPRRTNPEWVLRSAGLADPAKEDSTLGRLADPEDNRAADRPPVQDADVLGWANKWL